MRHITKFHPISQTSIYWTRTCYRPQRSWAKVIFSQACVKNSVHRGRGEGVCLSACWDIPPRPGTPPGPGTPPQSRHPPGTRHPPQQTLPPGTRNTQPPQDQAPTPPRDQAPPPPTDQASPQDQAHPPPETRHNPAPEQTPPPPEADCSIRSTSGRYASYWNAFLFSSNFDNTQNADYSRTKQTKYHCHVSHCPWLFFNPS